MAKLVDGLKRTWELKFNVALIPRLRAVGYEMNNGLDEIDKLTNPELLASALFVMVEKQAAAAGVSPEDFAEGLDGPTIDASIRGWLEALSDFTQTPKAAGAHKQLLMGILDKAEAKQIEELTTEKKESLKELAGSLPESSESIRGN